MFILPKIKPQPFGSMFIFMFMFRHVCDDMRISIELSRKNIFKTIILSDV